MPALLGRAELPGREPGGAIVVYSFPSLFRLSFSWFPDFCSSPMLSTPVARCGPGVRLVPRGQRARSLKTVPRLGSPDGRGYRRSSLPVQSWGGGSGSSGSWSPESCGRTDRSSRGTQISFGLVRGSSARHSRAARAGSEGYEEAGITQADRGGAAGTDFAKLRRTTELLLQLACVVPRGTLPEPGCGPARNNGHDGIGSSNGDAPGSSK